MNNHNNNHNNNNLMDFLEALELKITTVGNKKQLFIIYSALLLNHNVEETIKSEINYLSSLNYLHLPSNCSSIKLWRKHTKILIFFLQNKHFDKSKILSALCNIHFSFSISKAMSLNPHVFKSEQITDVKSLCFEGIISCCLDFDLSLKFSFTTILQKKLNVLLSRELFQRSIPVKVPEPIFYMRLSLKREIKHLNTLYSVDNENILCKFNEETVKNPNRNIVGFFSRETPLLFVCYDIDRGIRVEFENTVFFADIASFSIDGDCFELPLEIIDDPASSITLDNNNVQLFDDTIYQEHSDNSISDSVLATDVFVKIHLPALKKNRPELWDRYGTFFFYVIDSDWDLDTILNSKGLFSVDQKIIFSQNPIFDIKNKELCERLNIDPNTCYRASSEFKSALKKIIGQKDNLLNGE